MPKNTRVGETFRDFPQFLQNASTRAVSRRSCKRPFRQKIYFLSWSKLLGFFLCSYHHALHTFRPFPRSPCLIIPRHRSKQCTLPVNNKSKFRGPNFKPLPLTIPNVFICMLFLS